MQRFRRLFGGRPPAAAVGAPQADGSMLFEDVVIAPYTELMDEPFGKSLHRGGPLWPAWSSQQSARLCRGGVPVDAEPERVAPTVRLSGRLAWGGPLVRHFGHQLTDFSTRLLPTLTADPTITVVFATKPKYKIGRLDDAPPFVRAIHDWFGLPPGQRVLITTPTIVKELTVFPQTEQLKGPGPSPQTLDLLDELALRRLGPPSRDGQTTYVSRGGQRSRFAGEQYLEEALRSAGVTVYRPEDHPLDEQVRRYRNSDHLVFAEGSAIHVMQLAGRFGADVVVLERRPGSRHAEALITDRAESLQYADVSAGLVHGLRPTGDPAAAIGISVLDEDKVVSTFERLGIDLGRSWRPAAFTEARDEDVQMWLETEERTARARVEGAPRYIQASLQASGVGHVRSTATGFPWVEQ